MRSLPTHPPRIALRARCILVGPGAAKTTAHLLQPVEVGWEIKMGIDNREGVNESTQHVVDRLLSPRMPPHPLDKSPLVGAVAKDMDIIIPGYHGYELIENIALLILAIRPKRVAGLAIAIEHDYSDEVDEPLLRVALKRPKRSAPGRKALPASRARTLCDPGSLVPEASDNVSYCYGSIVYPCAGA